MRDTDGLAGEEKYHVLEKLHFIGIILRDRFVELITVVTISGDLPNGFLHPRGINFKIEFFGILLGNIEWIGRPGRNSIEFRPHYQPEKFRI